MPFLPANVAHYARYRIGLDTARTQTTEAERDLLRALAGGRKVIVEMGVFEGVSSLILRAAMDEDAELFCIDPFPKGRCLFSPQLGITRREIARSRNGKVHMIRQPSYEAIRGWSHTIDLLFMDADHSFEGVVRDFMQWAQFVRGGAPILVHTSRSSENKFVPDHCGPLRLIEEVVTGHSDFEIAGHVDSITIVRKRQAESL